MKSREHQWRSICPDLTIRSTFIVGFPGETEEEFTELLDFIHEARLNRVGCFTYSPVEGASANTLENPVPEEIKQDRLEQFMEVQADISRDLLINKRGQQITVLCDKQEGPNVIARGGTPLYIVNGCFRHLLGIIPYDLYTNGFWFLVVLNALAALFSRAQTWIRSDHF